MLANKIALVTGGSRGLGRAIAIALAKEKATVIINYSGNKTAAQEVKEIIESNNGKAEIYQCNVGNFDETKTMMDYIVKEHGQIDILVNNAGITKDNLMLKMSEEEFDQVMDINLKGAFNTIKHSTKYMLKKRTGRIINISSVSGITGNVGQANYSASKAGLIGLSKTMAKELAGRGITCNVVAPGFIATDMSNALSDNIKEKVLEQIPMKKFGEPEDIAAMVAFLAGDGGNYITGQVFQVDGGIAI